MPIAFANDEYANLAEIGHSLSDAGFVWGAVVTDRCRTYAHKPFRLDDHLRRFRKSCRLAGVPLEKTETELKLIVRELIDKNADRSSAGKELFFVFLATPGPVWAKRPTLVVYPERIDQDRYARNVSDGAKLLIAGVRHIPAACLPPEIKHRSRLFWRRAEHVVQERPPDAAALLLDPDGQGSASKSATSGARTSRWPRRRC